MPVFRRSPPFGLRDFTMLLKLAAGSVAATVVPRRYDAQVAALLWRLCEPLVRRRMRGLSDTIRHSLKGFEGEVDAERIAEGYYRNQVELWWNRFGGMRWRGGRVATEVVGREHLSAALQRGKGVLLWRMDFGDNPIFLQALWDIENPVTHLSSEGHGAPDRSQMGVEWVATLYQRAENAYLRKRIQIPRGSSLSYVRVLLAELRKNICVSIAGEHSGRQNVTAPLLAGEGRFATGAPSLAWYSNAVLLTSYTVRVEPFRYRVVIEKPIEIDRSVGRRQFVDQSVGEFTRRLEEQIRRHPADWQGWPRLALAATSPRAVSASGHQAGA